MGAQIRCKVDMGASQTKPGGSQQSPETSPSALRLYDLPVDALQLICGSLELRERVSLLSCCRALWSLEPKVLRLEEVAVALPDLRHAKSWAAFLRGGGGRGGRGGRMRRLAMQLPPQERFVGGEDNEGEQQQQEEAGGGGRKRPRQCAPWLWRALDGSASLTHLTWDALAHEGILPEPRLDVGFAYPCSSSHLPALRELVVRAPVVRLRAGLSQLPALTHLSLAGFLLELGPGCLPPSLLSLEVDWRVSMTPVTAQPRHLSDLAAAAGGGAARGLQRLRLVGALASKGLGAFVGLTSLEWAGGYIPSLEELPGLTALRRLALSRLQVTSDLPALLELRQLSALALCGVATGENIRQMLRGIWELPGLQDLTMTELWCQGVAVAGHSPPAPLPGSAPHLTRLRLDAQWLEAPRAFTAVAGLGRLRSLELLNCAAAAEGAMGLALSRGLVAEAVECLPDMPALRRLELRPGGLMPWEPFFCEDEGDRKGDSEGSMGSGSAGSGGGGGPESAGRHCQWLTGPVCEQLEAVAEACPHLELVY